MTFYFECTYKLENFSKQQLRCKINMANNDERFCNFLSYVLQYNKLLSMMSKFSCNVFSDRLISILRKFHVII